MLVHLIAATATIGSVPFETAQVYSSSETSTIGFGRCPAVVAAPKEMGIGSHYVTGDPSASRVDVQAVERESVRRRPISRPVWTINRLADQYLAAPAAERKVIANCLQQHFLAQARGQAMMGAVSQYDNFYREWMIGALAIAYLKAASDLRELPGSGEIRAWFVNSGHQIAASNQLRMSSGKLDNHTYWGGLAVLAVGKTFGDVGLTDFGRSIRTRGLASVQKDGSLLAELRRKQLSFHYHVFAAAPLAVLIYLDTSTVSSSDIMAMERLASYIGENLSNSVDGPIARLVGSAQAVEDRPVLLKLLIPFICDPGMKRKVDIYSRRDVAHYQFLGGDLGWMAHSIKLKCL